jgi:hypothetical protein
LVHGHLRLYHGFVEGAGEVRHGEPWTGGCGHTPGRVNGTKPGYGGALSDALVMQQRWGQTCDGRTSGPVGMDSTSTHTSRFGTSLSECCPGRLCSYFLRGHDPPTTVRIPNRTQQCVHTEALFRSWGLLRDCIAKCHGLAGDATCPNELVDGFTEWQLAQFQFHLVAIRRVASVIKGQHTVSCSRGPWVEIRSVLQERPYSPSATAAPTCCSLRGI